MFSGQYLDYVTYKELGGTLEDTPFNLLEYNARKKIDERTFGRLIGIDPIPNEVKLCVYELINVLDSYSSYKLENKGVSSESIDGYSISYQAPNKTITEAQESEVKDIINTYLANTLINGNYVLYRGAK